MPETSERTRQGHNKWMTHERGPYIRMHSGRQFFLADPRPEDLFVPDIAHHLARIKRYTGASDFSVAQHCVVASLMAERYYPGEKLLPARMLVHDVVEHAYGDVSSPLKSMLSEYKAVERNADLVVERAFDITFVGDPLVKEVDDRMWLTERLVVYPYSRVGDISEDYSGPLEPFGLDGDDLRLLFSPWGARQAELAWLDGFRRLLPWVKW